MLWKVICGSLYHSCRFIRDDREDAAADDRWAVRLAKRYYAKLYREYAIVDLSRYKVTSLSTTHLCCFPT